MYAMMLEDDRGICSAAVIKAWELDNPNTLDNPNFTVDNVFPL